MVWCHVQNTRLLTFLPMYPFCDAVWTGNDGPHCTNHDDITSFKWELNLITIYVIKKLSKLEADIRM